MVGNEQLAVSVDVERGNLHRGVGDFAMPHDLLSIVLARPDLAGRVVAVKVRSLQLGKFRTVVNDSAGQRSRLGMRMLERRLHVRMRAGLAFQVKRMAAFVNAPAVVLALVDLVNLLPQILSVLSDPDVTGLRVGRHSPRISQAVRPSFRSDSFLPDERVVFGDGVLSPFVRMVDVQSQDLGQQMIEALSGEVGIGVGSAVASRHVEHAIEAKRHRRSVMAVRSPLKNDLCGIFNEQIWSFTLQRVTSDSATLVGVLRQSFVRPVVPEIEVSILCEVRVEADAVGRVVDFEQNIELTRRHLIGRRTTDSELLLGSMILDEDQLRTARFGRHKDRPVDLKFGDRSYRPVRQRRFRRTSHSRRRHRVVSRNAEGFLFVSVCHRDERNGCREQNH